MAREPGAARAQEDAHSPVHQGPHQATAAEQQVLFPEWFPPRMGESDVTIEQEIPGHGDGNSQCPRQAQCEDGSEGQKAQHIHGHAGQTDQAKLGQQSHPAELSLRSELEMLEETDENRPFSTDGRGALLLY